MDTQMLETQLNLELMYSDRNVNTLFESHKEILTAEPMALVHQFLSQPYDAANRPDLVDVHIELYRKMDKLEDILFSMITFVLVKGDITLQAVVGTVFNAFECSTYRRRTILIEVLLQAVAKCKYIRIERKGDYMYFQSRLPLNDVMAKKIDAQGFVLPLVVPPKVRSNKSIGYSTFDEHVISGGKLKEHKFDVALDHLNRLNSTAYTYEDRLSLLVAPKFNAEPKVKDDGEYETRDDIKARLASFQQLHSELPAKTTIMMEHGNRFYLAHKYDNRIRTYVKSTHFNYMGTKFLKSMVHFADKEVSTGEW